ARGVLQGGNRDIEVAMFLLQARQLVPQLALFLFGHCRRCSQAQSAAPPPATRRPPKLSGFGSFRSSLGGGRPVRQKGGLLHCTMHPPFGRGPKRCIFPSSGNNLTAGDPPTCPSNRILRNLSDGTRRWKRKSSKPAPIRRPTISRSPS